MIAKACVSILLCTVASSLRLPSIRSLFPSSRHLLVRPVITRMTLNRGANGADGFGGGGNGNGMGGGGELGDSEKQPSNPSGEPAKQSAVILFLTKLFESYSNALTNSPYATKIITSGFVGGTGDILIQTLQRRKTKQPFDFRRLLVFSIVAALYIAPVIHVWFNYLNAIVMPAGFNKVAVAGAQMILDQTFGAVFINAGFFYAFEAAQQLVPPYDNVQNFLQAGTASMKNNLWETLVVNWYCWPAINFVNFLFVPIQFRLLFSNIAAVFWNMFLSRIANRAIE